MTGARCRIANAKRGSEICGKRVMWVNHETCVGIDQASDTVLVRYSHGETVRIAILSHLDRRRGRKLDRGGARGWTRFDVKYVYKRVKAAGLYEVSNRDRRVNL